VKGLSSDLDHQYIKDGAVASIAALSTLVLVGLLATVWNRVSIWFGTIPKRTIPKQGSRSKQGDTRAAISDKDGGDMRGNDRFGLLARPPAEGIAVATQPLQKAPDSAAH